jgi:hypothetical protein
MVNGIISPDFNTATKIDNKYETGGLKATFRIKAKYRQF